MPKDFWDLSDFLKKKRAMSSEQAELPLTEVRFSHPEDSEKNGEDGAFPEEKITDSAPGHTVEKAENTVTEFENFGLLLPKIRVEGMHSRYHFYDAFLSDVQKYKNAKPTADASFLHFFTYVPQYSDLSDKQLDYYFYLRKSIRENREEVPKAEESYLILYAFEIINRTDLNGDVGFRELYKIWKRYHSAFPAIEEKIIGWMAEYGIIHGIMPDFSSEECTYFASFGYSYYWFSALDDEALAKYLVSNCTKYNYKKSAFYTEGRKETIDAVMGKVGKIVLMMAKQSDAFFTKSKVVRLSFDGALCASYCKKHFTLETISLPLSVPLTSFLTFAMRRAENRLRDAVHFSSRLSEAIPDGKLSEYLPEWESRLDEMMSAVALPVERPDYEKNYDVAVKPLSVSDAKQIETASWDITDRLVPEEANEASPLNRPVEDGISPVTAKENQEENIGETAPQSVKKDDEKPFSVPLLRAIIVGDKEKQKQIAKEEKKPLSVLAEEINLYAVETFGDILVEEIDGGYAVLADYTEEAETMLKETDEII